MAMNMRRAFNAKMMVPFVHYSVAEGYHDDNNDWVEGAVTYSTSKGVITSGNKFSQFDEGEALKMTNGGDRFSNYKALYVHEDYLLERNDRVGYNEGYFKIATNLDEAPFGFRGYLIEKVEEWIPPEDAVDNTPVPYGWLLAGDDDLISFYVGVQGSIYPNDLNIESLVFDFTDTECGLDITVQVEDYPEYSNTDILTLSFNSFAIEIPWGVQDTSVTFTSGCIDVSDPLYDTAYEYVYGKQGYLLPLEAEVVEGTIPPPVSELFPIFDSVGGSVHAHDSLGGSSFNGNINLDGDGDILINTSLVVEGDEPYSIVWTYTNIGGSGVPHVIPNSADFNLATTLTVLDSLEATESGQDVEIKIEVQDNYGSTGAAIAYLYFDAS